ncbi:MAG: 50S ribosomal protein L22 [Clostridium sp.]
MSKAKTIEKTELQAVAHLRNVRISNRKVKIVADLIRNKDVEQALNILEFAPKAASKILIKLLNSAIANAENNHKMKKEKLYIAKIYANEGPTMKRVRPRAQGRAAGILKRTSHITIVLKERG